MIRRLPRTDLIIVDSPIMKNGSVDFAELMIYKTVHEEACLKIKGLPILPVSSELVSVQKAHESFALLPPFHIPVGRGFCGWTETVDAPMFVIKAVAQGMIHKREAGAANRRVLLPPQPLCRFDNQPTCLKIQPILGFLRVAVAIGHGPIVMEIVTAVARSGIDDLVGEQIQKFPESHPHLTITSDVVECSQGFNEPQMPVIGLPSEGTGTVRTVFVVFDKVPICSERDAVPTKFVVVRMAVDYLEKVQSLPGSHFVVKGQSVLRQALHHIGHRIQLLRRVDYLAFPADHKVVAAVFLVPHLLAQELEAFCGHLLI